MVENEPKRILISLIGLFIGSIAFLLSTPPWDVASAATVYYSVLAFLCITISVCSINRSRTDPSPAHSFFTAGTLYASMIFGGAAIFYLYNDTSPVTHMFTSGIFLNLVAFATTGVAIFLYSYLQHNPPSQESIWNNRYLPILYIVVGVSTFVSLIFITRSFLEQDLFLGFGYLVGAISLTTYLSSAIMTFSQRRKSRETHDPIRLSISFGLLAIATTIHMLILPSPNILWIGSITMMTMAFIYAIVATGYTYLIDLEVDRTIAYSVAVSISILVVLPFLVTQLIEGFISAAPLVEIGAPMLIHVGGCIFAGTLTVILYITSRSGKYTYVYPVIAILLYWTIAEFSLFVSHLIPLYGTPSETRVPYVVGSIVSIFLLLSAVRQILQPTEETVVSYSNRYFAYLGIIYVFMISAGEIIQKYLFDTYPLLFTGKFGTALMLGLSYLSLFLLLDFFLLLSSLFGGEISFDSLAVGSLSIWLVVTIMKASFSIWTVGYWAAEAVLAISVLVFPILLLYYFLRLYNRNSILETNATIYSSFVSERIDRHHTQAIDALEKMTQQSGIEDRSLESISRTMQEISLAEELTKAMCSVLQEDSFNKDSMEAMDLVDIIHTSIERLVQFDQPQPPLTINKMRGSCYVFSNSLLIDAFQRFFEGVQFRLGNIGSIHVTISQGESDITPSWHGNITIEVSTQNATKSKFLFDRYTTGEWTPVPEFAFAYRLVKLLNGEISANSIIGASTQLWLEVKIQIPSTPAI